MNFRKIACIIGMSITCMASEPWSNKDVTLETGCLLSLAADWRQTSEIHKFSNIHETNSIMGTHPEQSTINQYFLACGLLHGLIADQLHGNWRTAWQCVIFGVEIAQVEKNYKIGLRIPF